MNNKRASIHTQILTSVEKGDDTFGTTFSSLTILELALVIPYIASITQEKKKMSQDN